jgi:gamma-butyrobetaine dioxygenase
MHIPPPWTWGDAGSPERVWSELCAQGLSWFRAPDAVAGVVGADPAAVAARLLGRAPFKLRRRRLEVVPGARKGYENSQQQALFHIDQDPYLPPQIQVLLCVRPADTGGESLFLDGWELARAIQRDAPALYRRLFETQRMIAFSNSRWFGPTISMRLGNVVLSHGAVAPPREDQVGQQVSAIVNHAPPLALRMTEGDVIVANNHRLLHGRTAFTDPQRLLIRLMIWLEDALPADPELARETRAVHDRIAAQVHDQPEWIRHRLGMFGADGWNAAALQHDFQRPPQTPDAESPEKLAELVAVWRGLRLGA